MPGQTSCWLRLRPRMRMRHRPQRPLQLLLKPHRQLHSPKLISAPWSGQ